MKIVISIYIFLGDFENSDDFISIYIDIYYTDKPLYFRFGDENQKPIKNQRNIEPNLQVQDFSEIEICSNVDQEPPDPNVFGKQ